MTSRFDKHQQLALSGLVLIPSVLVKRSLDEATTQIVDVGKMYTDDLPFPSCLHGEAHTWHLKWTEENSRGSAFLPTTLETTLPHATSMFPNITELLRILCTLPVTSCSAEQSFSGLKRIKTAMRSKMGNDRLTSNALLHLHRDVSVEVPTVINEFAKLHPTRLEVGNILSDN
ncbi:PREDICTED: 52 kDa repressor of the inhibitor of the protein kinase-like [Amphimedon queenslandica]|uniref:HAT C-terminal dimerisation domain-containing protein n=1 Tax=Amphimedon queenslandica TaxID=400682 RepID=A0A1X7VPH5_AMPQE|nr:PREDICTED: 52 kDa repressor of the inhibitor of the protein kinase-like [Amphimedon queenslandica]|eukprot:XP_011409433.1 PREDICTED: 52 kDa repressor of the inhibitor of the protein kinase-like [Amphimedon queenslandica]